MVQITALAKAIEEELNGDLNAVSFGLKFKVHANAGNYKKAVLQTDGTKQKYINGVLRGSTGNYMPVKGLNNLFASLMLEFAVPQEKVDEAEMVLSSWTESVLGEVFTMGNWNFLITPQPATPGTVKNATPIGSTVPLLIVLSIQFIKNGLISNVVKWTLDGNEVRPEVVGGTWDRTPDVKPKANKGTCTADNQYETETIVWTLPYAYNVAVQTLMNDIIAHNISKVYAITRNDGFSNTLSGEYIITHVELNEQSGKIVSLTLTFQPADLILTE